MTHKHVIGKFSVHIHEIGTLSDNREWVRWEVCTPEQVLVMRGFTGQGLAAALDKARGFIGQLCGRGE